MSRKWAFKSGQRWCLGGWSSNIEGVVSGHPVSPIMLLAWSDGWWDTTMITL